MGFDHSSKLGNARYQKSCGSCSAFASVSSIEKKL